MLKEIVDETSVGKYDFMYLRIGKYCPWPTAFVSTVAADADNLQILQIIASTLRRQFVSNMSKADNISVGYAFINFEDVSGPLC